MFSQANVEKVVNPPQNPIAKRNFKSEDTAFDLCRYAKIIPIKRLPITLTDSVAIGNLKSKYLVEKSDTINRNMLPIPPPRPTSKICLIIDSFLFYKISKNIGSK